MHLQDLTNITSQNKDFVWIDSANQKGPSFLAWEQKDRKVFESLEDAQGFTDFLKSFSGRPQNGIWVFYLSYECFGFNPTLKIKPQFTPKHPLAEFRFYKNVEEVQHSPTNNSSQNFEFKNFQCGLSKKAYQNQFQTCLKKIHSGEFFEINLTLPFEAHFEGNPQDLYLQLRHKTKAPMMAWLNWDDLTIMSASPERFFKTDFNTIDCFPIKGTRKRGVDVKSDQELIEDLSQNSKEKAELLMVTDMIRHDLGQLCIKQGVSVPDLRFVESFPYYHHAISHIQGQLQKGLNFYDLFKALFPGSSITGAPKIQVMKTIQALEQRARGIYTGAIGYIDTTGQIDCNIPIRTLTLKNNKVEFAAGGGLVADSDYEKEWEECFIKASALIDFSTDYQSVDDCLQFHNLIHTP